MTRRPLLVLAMVAALAVGIVLAVLRVVLPAPAPPDTPLRPPVTRPLARHLLFVVVDGLRYDVATDPARMPHFARAMREHSSGEMWAGRVSMTTSAVLEFGTGQPGRLEQIVMNLNPRLVAYDSWLENAARAGLDVDIVGDPAWVEMYGPWLRAHALDPPGAAIDVDFNPQAFAGVRRLLARRPSVLIAHFVTPDHQGHAYGVSSARYAKSIHAFDRDLSALLDEVPADTTVVVTSDHGAADSGTHGADVPVQRRVPFYAYGPGIARGVHPERPLSQSDVAGTLAALLGVAAPAHGQGHLLVDWLDLSPAERARVACNDAERAYGYGEVAVGAAALEAARSSLEVCRSGAKPEVALGAARRVAGEVSAAVTDATGLGSRAAWLAASVIVLAALAIAFTVFGASIARYLPASFLVGALGLLLLYFVERLPGAWPNVTRGVLFGVVNLGVLLTLLWPGRAAAWLERHAALAPALLPGLLVVSYPTNTQPESYVAVAVVVLVVALAGGLRATAPSLIHGGRLALSRAHLAALLVMLAVLFPVGTRSERPFPPFVYEHPGLLLAAACAALTAFLVARGDRRSRRLLGLLVLAAVGSLLARRVAPPMVGRALLVLTAVGAAAAALSGRSHLAVSAGVIAYTWVSRDFEIVPFVCTVAIAESVGVALSRAEPTPPGSMPNLLLLASFVFGLLFVQRMGVQGALDFGAMDWGVAGFGDPHVSEWLVGAALGYKYVLAELVAIGALATRLDRAEASRLAPALVVMYAARSVMLLLMLMFCGASFWTALRVLSDLPFGLTGAVAATLAWLGLRYSSSRSSSSSPSSSS